MDVKTKTAGQANVILGQGCKPSPAQPERLVRWATVKEQCGIPKSTAYWLMSKGLFPRPVSLTGGRAVAWRASDIASFIASRVQKAF